MISTFHLIIVGVVVFLLFGSKLPSVMKNLGKGIKEFKDTFHE